MSSGCYGFVETTHGLPLRKRGFDLGYGRFRCTEGSNSLTVVKACLSRRAFLIAAGGGVGGVGAAYDRWATNYEVLDGRTKFTESLGLTEARRALCGKARGDVLEIGVGTGVNLPLYDGTLLKTLTCIDASSGMLEKADGTPTPVPARLVQARAEALPFADGSFDTVLDTFSLCTFSEPLCALYECRRVLRRGENSRLLLLEHTASDNGLLRKYQDVISEGVRKLSKGCVWNQRVEELVEEAGFKVVKLSKMLAGTIVSMELRVGE